MPRPSFRFQRSRRWWFGALFLAAGLTVGPRALPAQDTEVPVDVQITLLYKILTFDRKLGARAPGDDIVVAILYQSAFRASAVVHREVLDALKRRGDSTIAGHPVHWVSLELSETPQLAGAFVRDRVDVIYVAPLRGIDLDGILAAARSKRVTSFTGVPQFVDRGLAVGIGLQRDRPRILINLTAARAEGADFTSQLLRVATVIEGQ